MCYIPRSQEKKLEASVMTSSSDDKNADCILPYFRLYN